MKHRVWTLGLVGPLVASSLCTVAASTVAAQEVNPSTRSATFFGEIDLEPIEPVIGLFVAMESERGCCQTDPKQEVWPTPQFELNLRPGMEYAFEGIGVFVDPQDDADDAYYYVRPTQTFDLSDGEEQYSFSQGLREIEIDLDLPVWDTGEKLVIKAHAQLDGVEFISVREWILPQESWRSAAPMRRIWVPKDVPVRLEFQVDLEDPDYGGLDMRWSVEVDQDTAKTSTSPPGQSWFSGTYKVQGASQEVAPGSRMYVELEGYPDFYGRMITSGEFLVRPPWEPNRTELKVQPMFMFQDGSSTTLSQHMLAVGPHDWEKRNLSYELHPRDARVYFNTSFALDQMRISLAKGSRLQDAQATVAVPVQTTASGEQRATGTFQLEAGEWQLGGLAANFERGSWWTRYQAWNSGLETFSTSSDMNFDLGRTVSLAHASLPSGQYTAQRTPGIKPRIRPTLQAGPAFRSEVTPGVDARGKYIDSVRSQGETLVGRAGHRYRMMVEDPDAIRPQYAFDVEFGCSQSVQSGGPGYTGHPASGPASCDAIEMLYEQVDGDGEILINRLSRPWTPPLGYRTWSPAPTALSSVDIQRNFPVVPGSEVTVCMQFNRRALAKSGQNAQDLVLAYPVNQNSSELGEPSSVKCPKGGRYASPGWCLMPSSLAPELIPFLDAGPDAQCGWRCGIADASALQSVSFLREEPSERPRVNCIPGDAYAETAQGFVQVAPPSSHNDAYWRGISQAKAEIREFRNRHGWGWGKVQAQVGQHYLARLKDRSLSDAELCRYRGKIHGFRSTVYGY